MPLSQYNPLVFVRVQAQHQALLDQVLTTMQQFEPPPG
jgi:hypothetical protein